MTNPENAPESETHDSTLELGRWQLDEHGALCKVLDRGGVVYPSPMWAEEMQRNQTAKATGDLVKALEVADAHFCNRHGYCPECGEYAGKDHVQGGRGDASNHESYCSRRDAAMLIQRTLAAFKESQHDHGK